MRALDLSGHQFDRLTVDRRDGSKGGMSLWLCRCVCGSRVAVDSGSLRSGATRSCGCLKSENARKNGKLTPGPVVHGFASKAGRIPEYAVWKSMRQRCSESAHGEDKENYFERGIRVCDEWEVSFETFIRDMGRRPTSKHSIERIDNDQGYCPENCRLATATEQANNRRPRRTKEVSR